MLTRQLDQDSGELSAENILWLLKSVMGYRCRSLLTIHAMVIQ